MVRLRWRGGEFSYQALVRTAFSIIIYINFHTPSTFIFFFFIYSHLFPILSSLSLSLSMWSLFIKNPIFLRPYITSQQHMMPARNTIQMAIQNELQEVKSDEVGGADRFQQTGVGSSYFFPSWRPLVQQTY